MIPSNDSLRVVCGLVLSGLLLCLIGCGKADTPRTNPAPLSKLVVESQPEPEAGSAAVAPMAENPPGDEGVEKAAVEMAPPGEATETAEAPGTPGAADQEPNGASKPPLEVPAAPAYVYKPEVFLSAGHLKTCLVNVGDPMPAFELPDLAGQTHKLPDLLGERFTVVVFWSSKNLLGREQIQRLTAEVAGPFGSSGVNVVAINSGDETGQIEALLPVESDRGFEVLVDESGSALASVATEQLPRSYLLDAEGRILWFDLEYSRATARELINALHFFLENGSGNDS